MTTKEKIKYYIDSKGISKNKFYTITGLSTSFLDSGNTIGVDKAKIIIEKFPDLSLEWLLCLTEAQCSQIIKSLKKKMIKIRNESINYWILSPPSKRRSNY